MSPLARDELGRKDSSGSMGQPGRNESPGPSFPRRQSQLSDVLGENAARRLSEAGVNRRPSATKILTEDTESFIVGERVWVDGVKPGRIAYIGETKFTAQNYVFLLISLRVIIKNRSWENHQAPLSIVRSNF